MAPEIQITFDCADPAALPGFWTEMLGYELQPPPPGFEDWDAALAARASRRATATTGSTSTYAPRRAWRGARGRARSSPMERWRPASS